ncbi:MAG: hypothetical protein E7035_07650 [Verrucomicrobiaceae bacterium]|nr:hypothetical protein [Verrucomicrobiaceae bacterium]
MKLVIDIGSNTIKCLLARVNKQGNIEKLFEHSLESRISAGGGILVENASTLIANSIEVLIEKAKAYCNNFQSIAVATSALRDAPNKEDVIADVLEKTSVAINVLSGYEEARLSYLGACSDNAIPNSPTKTYFDLGGGSMEIVFGNSFTMKGAYSLPIGAVSVTKKFCTSEKISKQTRTEISDFVAKAFANIPKDKSDILVGAGGAVVAARLLNEKINGVISNKILLSDIETFVDVLSEMSVSERVKKFFIAKSRADILVSALICVGGLMRHLGHSELLHTFNNLRYGVIINEHKK